MIYSILRIIFFLITQVQFIYTDDFNIVFINSSTANDLTLNDHYKKECKSDNQFNGYYFQGKSCSTQSQQKYQNIAPHFGRTLISELIYLNDVSNQYATLTFTDNSNEKEENKVKFMGIQSELQGSCNIQHFYRGGFLLEQAQSTSFNLNIIENCFMGSEYAITLLQININTCHPSCLKCNGQAENNCTQCSENKSTDNKCSCRDSNQFLHQGKCVSICPSNYIKKDNYCIFKPNCIEAVTNQGQCQKCVNTFLLWDNNCIKNCVAGYQENNGICQNEYNNTSNDKINYFLKGALFQQDFSMIEVKRLGFEIQNAYEPDRFAKMHISYCKGFQLFGGFFSYQKNSVIIFPKFQSENKFIQIIFQFFIIDSKNQNKNTNIFVNLNGQQLEIQLSGKEIKQNFCGLSQLEIQDTYNLIKQVNGSKVNKINIEISIVNQNPDFTSSGHAHSYFGIREISVIGVNCAQNTCVDCTEPLICTQCENGYYLENKQCNKCHESCKTCNGSAEQNCLTCIDNRNFNKENKCIVCDLQNGYFIDKSSNKCFQCTQNCLNCTGPDKNDCTKCQNSYILETINGSKDCKMCDINAGRYIENGQCLQCIQNCNICSNNNSCQQCLNGYFFNQVTLQCQKCEQNCIKCNKDLCVECEKDYSVSEITKQCVLCKDLKGFYFSSTDKLCKKCHSECASCKGSLNTECISCAENSKKINEISNQCAQCELQKGFFIDNMFCRRCVAECQLCSNPYQCSTCNEGYFLKDSDKSCQKCQQNCQKCNQNQCIECQNGYQLQEQTNLCIKCVDQPSHFIDGQQCKKCHSDCTKCNGSSATQCIECSDPQKKIDILTNVCINCDTSKNNFIDANYCKKCHNDCGQCKGPLEIDCLICNDSQKKIDETSNKCINCQSQPKYFVDGQNCRSCITGCDNCKDQKICQQCQKGFYLKSDQTCEKCQKNCIDCSGQNNCTQCEKNFFINEETKQCVDKCEEGQYLDGLFCKKCHPDCQQCKGPLDTDCVVCLDNQKSIHENTQKCVDCSNFSNFYRDEKQCRKCNKACKSCTGLQDSDCLICEENYEKVKIGNISKCIFCNNKNYYDQSSSYCQECENQCVPCKDANNFNINLNLKELDSLEKNSVCKLCQCKKCKDSFPLFEGQCVDSCSSLGENLVFSAETNSCACKVGYPYKIKSITDKNKTHCSKIIPFKFFCDPQNNCTECQTKNCEACSSIITCQTCEKGFYLWQNKCIESCEKDQKLVQNENERICQCEKGYIYQRKQSKNGIDERKNEEYECFLPLQIGTMQLINALMQDSSKEDIIQNPNSNYLIVNFNRQLKEEEEKDFKIKINNQMLQDNSSEIKIIKIEFKNNLAIVEIESTKNTQLSQIEIIISQQSNKIQMQNTLLVSKKYAEINSSPQQKQLTTQMESISQIFAPQKEGAFQDFVNFLKKFQILCSVSNFVQILTPITLLSNSLPPLVKFGSLLGASFVFTQIPPPQQFNFEIQPQKNSTEIDDKNRVLQSDQSESDNLKYDLSYFGLKENLYENFLLIHLLTAISSILIILCLFVKRLLRHQKQHTLLVVNKLINFLSTFLQGSVTVVLFSIYFSLTQGQYLKISIFQIVAYSLFYGELLFIILTKPPSYLNENLPNVFQNIHFQATGAKSYIIVQFIKKYIVILLHLTLFNHAYVCSIIVSSIFLLCGIYILYFRFFTTIILNVAKIFQELNVAVLYATIAYTVKFYKEVQQSETISDNDLITVQKLAYTILILIVIGIILSTSIFILRLFYTIQDIVKIIQDYFQKKKQSKNYVSQNNLQMIQLIKSDSPNKFMDSNNRDHKHSSTSGFFENQENQNNQSQFTESCQVSINNIDS